MLKRRSVLAATAGWTIVGASAVRAQTWPSQQVKIVVPYIPGGATDTAGRVVAEKMGALLGQQVIVENRGGGNTIIGMELVAKSKPDGHTLLLGTTTLATNAALGLKQPYDPLKDFQPISTLADIPDLVAVNKSVPVTHVRRVRRMGEQAAARKCATARRASATSRICGPSCCAPATISRWRTSPTRAWPTPCATFWAATCR